MPEPQRKSFLRRGGEIFANLILEEETPTAGKSASAAKSAGARTAVMDRVAQRDMVSRVHDEVDADTLEALHQEVVLSEHTDFTIFHEKMEQLRDVIPDEATLFAAAAKTSGSSKAKLVSAVGRHLQLLAQEREEFARETDRRVSEKVASLRAKQEGTQSEIASMDAQIAQLQERQRALRETLSEQSRAIDEENSRIENGRKVFSLAADTLQKTLEESREKINQFLKGA